MAYKKALTDEEQRLIDELVKQPLTIREMHDALGYSGGPNSERIRTKLAKAGYPEWEPAHPSVSLWKRGMERSGGMTLFYAIYQAAYERRLKPKDVAKDAGVGVSVVYSLLRGDRFTHGANLQAIIDTIGASHVYKIALMRETDGF